MRTKKSTIEILEEKHGRLTFAIVLRSWRISEEMSQTSFAKKLGISVQNLNDLEKGRKIPSPRRADKIARKLGLTDGAMITLVIRDLLYRDGFKFNVYLESA